MLKSQPGFLSSWMMLDHRNNPFGTCSTASPPDGWQPIYLHTVSAVLESEYLAMIHSSTGTSDIWICPNVDQSFTTTTVDGVDVKIEIRRKGKQGRADWGWGNWLKWDKT